MNKKTATKKNVCEEREGKERGSEDGSAKKQAWKKRDVLIVVIMRKSD